VVATPIGNLGDITLRALEVLKQVTLIACEDTRTTRKLLNHFSIPTRTSSCHKFNEKARSPRLVEKILSGEEIALVTDGGTPCISDPGHLLIRSAIEAGVDVIPVPGPSAFVAAVSAAGIAAERIHFEGFLPARGAARRTRIGELAPIPDTLVLYEAPHRIHASLRDLAAALGPRPAALCREITKRYEEWIRDTLDAIGNRLPDRVRGEITMVIKGSAGHTPAAADIDERDIIEAIRQSPASSRSQAIREVARRLGIPRREAYRMWLRSGDRDREGR
jgi:16S rRNA (cytidine1402-2'-O)-methyltransferase